jgi:hypothetical protein
MKLTNLNENKTLAEYEKEWEEQNGKTCDKCGTKLNDGGTCPKCDDGEEESLKEAVSGTNSEEFDSYAAAIERHKANGNEKELDAVITSAYNDLNGETRLTGVEFNKLCDLANFPNRKVEVREAYHRNIRKPKYYDTRFAANVVDAYNSGELTLDNIEDWEKRYNGGIAPSPSLGTKDILDYYRITGAVPGDKTVPPRPASFRPGSSPLAESLDRYKEEKHTRHYGKDYDDEFTLMGY